MTTTIDRRKFMAAGGVTAVTAAAAGVSGELLLSKRLRARPPAANRAAPAPPQRLSSRSPR